MTYEEFKIAMTTKVTNLAGEEVDVTVRQVPKNNGVIMDAITVMQTGDNVAPTVYLKDFYMRYEEGVSLEQLAAEVLEVSRKGSIRGKIPINFFLDFSGLGKRICYKLINYEKNKDRLKTIPHRRILDLAMVFYYHVEPDIIEHATVLVRNTDMERWKTDVKELERLARENTPRILGWDFSTLTQIIQEILDEGAKEEENPPMEASLEEDEPMPMYILTNREKYYGAACMLYPEALSAIAEQLNDHLYILPSSIHECIIMPVSGHYTRKSLGEMVTEINETQVEESEILSNHVYYYDRKTKKLSL